MIHTPRHVVSIGELAREEVGGVAAAWRQRAATARREGFGYVHAFLNEGRAAGGSLPHTHSQLVWLAGVPPAVAAERGGGDCGVCRLLRGERSGGSRIVDDTGALVALCPPAGRAPYELLLAPVACEQDGLASDLLESALALLAGVVGTLRSLEGDVPLNAWLHTGLLGGGGGHWHLELVPRLTVPAGLELGAGLYVNPLPAEQAAARLRGR